MKCEEVRALLEDFCEGNLADSISKEARLHIEGCESCRREAESARRLAAALAQVKIVRAPERAVRATITRVRGEAAKRAARRDFARRAIYAAAASIIAVVAILGLIGHGPKVPVAQAMQVATAVETIRESESWLNAKLAYYRDFAQDINLWAQIALVSLAVLAVFAATVQAHETRKLEMRYARFLR